jgi:hypothetical protein
VRKKETGQTLRLQLLALVLALLLVWYTVNPAPGPVIRQMLQDDAPDEKKREAEPQLQRGAILTGIIGRVGAEFEDLSSPVEDVDDFEWPEFIDG